VKLTCEDFLRFPDDGKRHELQMVHVHRREGSGFGAPVNLSNARQDMAATPLLAGLELPLAKLFAG
jgi:hypothetical protein